MAVATAERPAITREKAEATPLQRAAKVGVVAGVVAVYLCVVGLVERFDAREVVAGVINMGRTLLITVALVAGYIAARPLKVRHGEPEPPAPKPAVGLAGGALAGAISGAIVGLFLLLASAIEMREVLTSVTEGLLDILSFGQDAGVGALLQVVTGAALGVLGAAAHLLSPANRKPLFAGIAAVLILSTFSRLFDDILTGTGEYIRLQFLDDTGWLYEGDGLTVFGAVLAFVAAAGWVAYTARRGKPIKARVASLPDSRQLTVKIVAFFLLAAFLAIVPVIAGRFISDILGTVGIYVLLGLGLNIVIGYAGLLDLGYVAFFAIGAYATAMLTSPAAFTEGPLNFWVAVPIVVIIATLCGVLIGAPVLRLRGDYLAIVTLGFGEIVRILVISEWLRDKTGGAQGILQIPDPSFGGLAFDDPQTLYYLIIICCFAAAFVAHRLQWSRIGRAWVAMREDEQVAEAMGISIIKTKLLAFAMGAAIGSFSGMFFAVKIGSVFPNSMSILVSILVLAVIVLGGMGSIPGVVVGAFVLVGLPDFLREFVEFRLLIYGAILVAIMILRPEGLIPSARRRAELHETEEEQLQYEQRHGDEATAAPVVVAAQPKDTT